MASIDSGFPKKMWVTPSGYEGLRICDSIRDRFGNFWVVGRYVVTASGNYLPTIWRFSGVTYILLNSWTLSTGVIDQTQTCECSGIAIDSADSIHVVGYYRDAGAKRKVFYTKKTYDSATFDTPIRIDEGAAGYDQALYTPPGATISLNADGNFVVMSNGRGWDAGREDWARIWGRSMTGAGVWETSDYISIAANKHEVGPHCAANRLDTLSDEWLIYFERENEPELQLWRVQRSGGTLNFIQVDNTAAGMECTTGIHLLFDGPTEVAHMLGTSDTTDVPALRARYGREGGGWSWPDDPGEQLIRGVAYNETEEKLLAIYERSSNSNMYARRRENLDAGDPGTWDTELQLTTSMVFTRASGICRPFPIVNSKRFGTPTHGFGFVVTSDSALLGDGETQPAIYFYALDSLTWLSPDAELSLAAADGIKFSDSAAAGFKILVALADGIKVSDTGAVVITISANAADGVKFSETLATVMALVAAVADGITLTDVATSVGLEAEGIVTVTFSLKKGAVTITIKKPTETWTLH